MGSRKRHWPHWPKNLRKCRMNWFQKKRSHVRSSRRVPFSHTEARTSPTRPSGWVFRKCLPLMIGLPVIYTDFPGSLLWMYNAWHVNIFSPGTESLARMLQKARRPKWQRSKTTLQKTPCLALRILHAYNFPMELLSLHVPISTAPRSALTDIFPLGRSLKVTKNLALQILFHPH